MWWADLPFPSGRRPVVLLSRDDSYAVRSLVIMSPVTTRRRGLPSEVELGPEDGLARNSVANLDVIITESKESLLDRVTVLPPEKMQAVDAAIRFALGLEQ